MDTNKIEADMGHMWKQKMNDYVLLVDKNAPHGYIIVDVVHKGIVIIEDSHTAEYVIRQMIGNGVKQVNDLGELISGDRPNPIFLTPDMEKQYNAWKSRQEAKHKKKDQ